MEMKAYLLGPLGRDLSIVLNKIGGQSFSSMISLAYTLVIDSPYQQISMSLSLAIFMSEKPLPSFV